MSISENDKVIYVCISNKEGNERKCNHEYISKLAVPHVTYDVPVGSLHLFVSFFSHICGQEEELKCGIYQSVCQHCGFHFKFKVKVTPKSAVTFSVNGSEYSGTVLSHQCCCMLVLTL